MHVNSNDWNAIRKYTGMDIIFILGFYIELFLLYKIEKYNWNTIFTPVIILAIPYAILLPISIICLNINEGYSFYYPSIVYWNFGLLLFEIPSYVISRYKNKSYFNKIKVEKHSSGINPIYLNCNALLIALLILRIIQISRTGVTVGSDEFGERFATYGLWGHLNLVLMIFTIGDIIQINKANKNKIKLAVLVILGLTICFLNQVKGWVLIPIIAGIIVRLKDQPMRLSYKLLILTGIVGISLFILSYFVSLVLLHSNDDNSWFIPFIIEHIIFYLTSGINGLSQYLSLGYSNDPDTILEISKMFYPIQILISMVSAHDIILPAGLYLDVFYGMTNVKTYFGEVFINGGLYAGIIIILFNSILCYFLLLLTYLNKSLLFKISYGFIGGILAMGWFSSYTNLLNTYEVPIFCIIIYWLQAIYNKRKSRWSQL